jgi:hypothetical protein
MYIEFYLAPSTISVVVVKQIISDEIDCWANRYDILYRTKIVRQTLRLTFDQDSYYTLFVTTWKPPKIPNMPEWQIRYCIVEPMARIQQ